MDIVFELILDLYLELALIFIPEEKLKKWQVITLKCLCLLIYFAVVALFALGIWLVNEENKTAGIALIVISSVIVLAQIVIFSCVLIHKHKTSKEQNQTTKSDSEKI